MADPNALDAADRGRFAQRVTVAAVPRARVLRGETGTWMMMSSRSAEAYAELTAGIRPRPARTLPDVGDAALPEARVDEVVEPPPATPAADPAGDGAPAWIAWLAGALLAATAAGLWWRRAGGGRAPRYGAYDGSGG